MKKYKKVIFVIELILIIFLLTFLISLKNNSKDIYKAAFEEEPEIEQENIDYNSIKMVSDNSIIPTIENCINKYMSYVVENDKETIFNILDDNYKINNNINKPRDINDFTNYEKEKNIKIREIYVKNDSSNIEKYYIRISVRDVTKTAYKDMGKDIVEELSYYDVAIEDSKSNIESDEYIIVKLDYENNIYTVEPTNEGQFKSIKNMIKE